MKRCQMTVRATPGGWSVAADRLATLMFTSGAHAERAAYQLARSQVQAGCDVELSIFDRQDELAAQITMAAEAPAAQEPYRRGAAVTAGIGHLKHIAATAFTELSAVGAGPRFAPHLRCVGGRDRALVTEGV